MPAKGHVLPVSGGYVELFRSNLAPTAAGARSLHILKQPAFREAQYIRTGQYQMVKQSHLDRSQRLRQPLGDQFISVALILYA